MIAIFLIIATLLALFAIAFISCAIVALQQELSNDKHSYIAPWIIIVGAACNFMILCLFLVGFIEQVNKITKKESPKYELIQTPVYKQVNP